MSHSVARLAGTGGRPAPSGSVSAGATLAAAGRAALDEAALDRILAAFPADTVGDVYPVSSLQAGMLFHSVGNPDDRDYLTQTAYRIDGEFHAAAFVAAWRNVIDRHDILRTTFAWADLPHPVQIVHRRTVVPLRQHDWRHLAQDREGVDAAMAGLLAEVRRSGLDLKRTPPLRLDLATVDNNTHYFVWHQHHVLLDGWSAALVLDEVYAAYASLSRDGRLPSSPEPVPYRAHIDWLQRRDVAAERAFWKQALADFETPTRLPFVAAGTADTRGETATLVSRLDPAVATRLARLAAGHRLTPNAVLQGAWALLLSKYSGETDVLYGTVVSGRAGDRPGLERAVGLLVNTVPLRVSVDERTRCVDWLTALQVTLNNVHRVEHADLAEIARYTRVPSGTRLFESIFQLVNFATTDRLPDDGLAMTAIRAYEQAGYPVGLTAAVFDECLLQLTYERDRVRMADAERFLASYVHLLTQLIDRPQARLGELTTVPPADRHLLLGEWSGVGSLSGYQDSCTTVPELFAATAARHSTAVAVVSDDSSLTYAQLDEAANRLAALLRRHGVRTDARVAVAVPRSVDLVVALLAVLKAGGAYLALDPANPRERIELMLVDSSPVVVLATEATRTGLASGARVPPIISLDDPQVVAALAELPPTAPPMTAAALSLAQICYTSGSTGAPKGVGLTHRSLVRLANRPGYSVNGPGEICSQLAPIAFDASAYELWATLLNGATLVIPPAGRLDVPDVAAMLRRHRVTVVGLITGMFHQVVEHDVQALASVRELLVGGDAALPEAFRTALRTHPGLRIVAAYGPTENTTVTTCVTLADPAEIDGRVPIGRPIAGTTVYVLDGNLEPVPLGAAGELYTGGAGVSRGYLNHPAATAERFLPDPFSTVPGTRMYRTGDEVCWRPDGMLDFLGRTDNQVKIRGFRVELSEIESRLIEHPDIAEAVVLAVQVTDGHKRLVAYVVPAADAQPPSISAVRAFVQAALPEYMAPSVVVPVDRIPLNANGKVDRRALPEPAEPGGHRPEPVAPRNPVEQALVAVWQDVLGHADIGVHDNYFDLGGDSILSIHIASRAREVGIDLRSRDLFAHQTIAELAAAVGSVARPSDAVPEAVVGEVPLTPIQQEFVHTMRAERHFNQSKLLLCRTRIIPGLLAEALTALVAHHDALRLRLTEQDGRWRQDIVDAAPQDLLRVVDLADAPEETWDQAMWEAADEVQRSLDLATGPIIRAALFTFDGARPDHILVVVHHLAVDVVSWGFLLPDLATGYTCLADGRAVVLPPKTTSFRDWAVDLHRYGSTAQFRAELSRWRARDTSSPLVSPERAEHAQPATGSVSVALTADETATLLHGLRTAGAVRPNELLLTALARVLRDHVADSVVIDIEGHGRQPLSDQIDVSRTVGWFTSRYPLSFRPEELSPNDLNGCLRLVRDRLRSVPNLGIGYGIARWFGAADTELALPGEVSFNYIGQPPAGADDDALFTELPDSLGREVAADLPASHLIDILAGVRDGRLELHWSFPPGRMAPAAVQRLADQHVTEVRRLMNHLTTSGPRVTDRPGWLDLLHPGTPLVAGPMARYRVPGVGIATVFGDEIVAWGHGFLGRDESAPVTGQSLFQVGSVSKHVTAVAVVRLAQTGRLDLDADVNMYLTSWTLPSSDADQPVTPRHLLTHTAGLASGRFLPYRRGQRPPILSDLLNGRDGDQPIRSVRRPGTHYEYAHHNYAVLEQLVVDVTGQAFPDAMRSLVLDPLKMRDSSHDPAFPERRADDVAAGHTATGRPYEDGWRVMPLLGAGGLWSTPRDLARLGVELGASLRGESRRHLSPAAAVELTAGLVDGYGLGTVVSTANGHRWFGHPGDSNGYRTLFAMDADTGAGLVVMANGDGATPLLEGLLADLGLDLMFRVQGQTIPGVRPCPPNGG
jgi:amino acid adenylation domain-containing protein/non-ribosomal peptide synthase protein (TIGR01720 family)